MNLVIVESPTKAKTITGFLGKDYKVISSYGHVRDLPKSKMGVEIEKDFEPVYVVPPKAEKVITELKRSARKADSIILATDEDREGEAIAWHLAQVLAADDKPTRKTAKIKKTDQQSLQRIVFHEITQSAIEEALKNPRQINLSLVNAQQARRVLDRLVGYELSPFLWRKIKYGLSAGRVQSAALRLIAEKEEEIKKFNSEEYWTISARLEKLKAAKTKLKEFEAELFKIGEKALDKLEIKNKEQAERITQDLSTAAYSVSEIEQKSAFKSPLAPFTTSTLQQESWQKLRYSAKQTMMLAQQLYEQGFITYMRTDSTNLSFQAIATARKFIEQEFSKEYVPEKPNVYKSKSKMAQEAHEAIRPTDAFKTPAKLKAGLDPKQAKVYDLIWKRFVACQMKKAELNQQTVVVLAQTKTEKYYLKANGQQIIFAGFLAVWQGAGKEIFLPQLEKGENLALKELLPTQHFTQPPARYNDASLVKTLEKLGIGRPSTYASIISTLLNRAYIERNESRALQPTYLGTIVNELLVKHFNDIVDYQFTAQIEDNLDKIAEDKAQWRKIIKNFYYPFHENLEKKEKEVTRREATERPVDETCDKCGSKMVIKFGRFGPFLGCSNYPACSNIKKIQSNEPQIPCPKCGTEKGGKVVKRKTKARKRIFYGCSRWPECDFVSWKKPEGNKEETEEE